MPRVDFGMLTSFDMTVMAAFEHVRLDIVEVVELMSVAVNEL